MKPVRFRALYETVGRFELMAEIEWQSAYSANKADHNTDAVQYLSGFRTFSTLKEAKRYLRINLRGDISDSRVALEDLRKWRPMPKESMKSRASILRVHAITEDSARITACGVVSRSVSKSTDPTQVTCKNCRRFL